MAGQIDLDCQKYFRCNYTLLRSSLLSSECLSDEPFPASLDFVLCSLILLLFRDTASTALWTRLTAQYQLPSEKGFPMQLHHYFSLCQGLALILC